MEYTIKNGEVFNASGKKLGSKDKDGYIVVNILTKLGRKLVRAHRYIYEHYNGPIKPGLEIDHINGIKDDNRIENLRLANTNQNQWNSKIRIDNKSGVKGVSWNNKAKKWAARIKHNKIRYNLGHFKTVSDAKEIIEKKRLELHGEFARNN